MDLGPGSTFALCSPLMCLSTTDVTLLFKLFLELDY